MTTITVNGGMPPKSKYFSPFKDVPEKELFHHEMNSLYYMGITTGWKVKSDSEYRPKLDMYRDAMIVFIYRSLGSPKFSAPSKSPFIDVKTNNIFYKEIAWAYSAGVSKGWKTSKGNEFRPLEPVNRDALAAFLFRASGENNYKAPLKSPFSDVKTNNIFYREIAWMNERGISNGWKTNKGAEFRPLESTKRDAMAAFLHRWITLRKTRKSPTGAASYIIKSPLAPELNGTITFNNLVAKRLSIAPNYETYREISSKGWEKWFNEQFAMNKSVDDKWMKPYIDHLPMINKNHIEASVLYKRKTGEEIAGNGTHFGAVQRIGTTVLRSLHSPRVVNEALTSFWLDHFSVPYEGIGSPAIFSLDSWIREKSNTNVFEIIWAMLRSVKLYALLDGLDSKKDAVNENLARELIELYTTGLTIGVEQDVRQLAILLTGYKRTWDSKADLYFNDRHHEYTTKPLVILGRSYPNANLSQALSSGERIIYDLAWDPRTIKFISAKMASHFSADKPTAAMVSEVEETYRRTGGNIKNMLRTIITHPDFVKNIGSKWKRPFEMMASHQRSLKPAETLAETLRAQTNPIIYNPCSEFVQRAKLAGHEPRNKQGPKGHSNFSVDWINSSSILHTINVLTKEASLAPKTYKITSTWEQSLGIKDTGDYNTIANNLFKDLTGFIPDKNTVKPVQSALSDKTLPWSNRVAQASSLALVSPYGFLF